ncbi:MAG: lipopolysaccharide kinase InaA family protein [Porticoccus sp.]
MERQFFHLDDSCAALFRANGLDSFEALWNAEVKIVDDPNVGRGGHSDVGIFSLTDAETQVEKQFYLKRQENHNCRTLKSPLQGIPLAMREVLNIRQLEEGGILTMDVACYGRDKKRADRAILVTCALDGYQPMSPWLEQTVSPVERKHGLQVLGRLVGRLHAMGLRHGCLYTKHIYFSCSEPDDIRLIDLEKCKRMISKERGPKELATLFRNTGELTPEDRQQFLEAYIETSPVHWSLPALEKKVADKIMAKG